MKKNKILRLIIDLYNTPLLFLSRQGIKRDIYLTLPLNIVIVLLVFLIINIPSLFALTEFQKKGTTNFNIYGGYISGSSYFDMEEKMIIHFKDITTEPIDSSRNYTVEFIRYLLGIYSEYALLDDLALYFNMPVYYSTLNEVYEQDENNSRKQRAYLSLFQPEYIAIGGKYLLYSRKAYWSAQIEMRVPPGFHNGIQNDPDYPFLSDGAFEALAGLNFGIKMEKSWLETSLFYNYRSEDLKDQFILHTEGGLASVPEATLRVTADIIQSLSSFKYAVPFDPRKVTLQENYFALGFGFHIFFSKKVYSDFSYRILLHGKNTRNIGTFLLSTGILIK